MHKRQIPGTKVINLLQRPQPPPEHQNHMAVLRALYSQPHSQLLNLDVLQVSWNPTFFKTKHIKSISFLYTHHSCCAPIQWLHCYLLCFLNILSSQIIPIYKISTDSTLPTRLKPSGSNSCLQSQHSTPFPGTVTNHSSLDRAIAHSLVSAGILISLQSNFPIFIRSILKCSNVTCHCS